MGNSINFYSRYNGISGLASGMDTESLVKKLLSTDQAKVDSYNADRQKSIWRQESYHAIMDQIKEFKEKYFDVLSTESYLFAKNDTRKVTVTNASNNASNYVEISADSHAAEGEHVINRILNLATSSTVSSSSRVIDGLTGTAELTFPLTVAENTSFGIALDGAYVEVGVSGTYDTAADLVDGLNAYFDNVYGTSRVTASIVDNKLQFDAPNSIVQVFDGIQENNFLDTVGMTNGQRNVLSLDSSLYDVLGEVSNEVKFAINGVSFEFTRDTTVREVMSTINSSKANVSLTYSSLEDKFTLKSKDTGEVSAIVIQNISGNFFGADSYVKITDSYVKNGMDAVFHLNDDSLTNPIRRSDNNFTIDGVRYSLKETTIDPISFEIEQDTEGMVETIKDFVKEFNELIADIEGKTKEKIYSDYEPLTTAQKSEMTERQIELWEEKAKSGLLRYDSNISKIVSDLKSAFWGEIEGVSSTLYQIGITTTSDYNNFELEIDEQKLEEAIEKDPQAVWDLFIKEGDIDYSRKLTSEEYSARFKEIGFAQRISDILENNISTIRDEYDMKGILVEKAGVDGDATEINNTFSQEILKLDRRINDAIERMTVKEQYYWKKFTAMETALQQMNSQSEWLYAQFYSQ